MAKGGQVQPIQYPSNIPSNLRKSATPPEFHMSHSDKSLNFIFPTKHVIPESLKFSHWLSEQCCRYPK